MGGKFVGSCVMAGLLACVSPVAFAGGQSVAVGTLPDNGAKMALVTLDVKNEPVERVLRMIAQQAGLKIFFPAEQVHVDARTSVQVRGVSVSEAFARALAGTGLQARVANGAVVLSAASRMDVIPMVQGGIAGKVVDAKTHQGLRGATVSLSGVGKASTTSDDGIFRISGVVPGAYTVQVRMLGYIKTTKTVTIVEGQTASIEIVMEPSVNALDQVVVTGTVVQTALKAVPNAMTIITAKDIEQRGITRIDQFFRGEVPGLFAINAGSSNALDTVTMFSRGATATNDGTSAGVSLSTNQIKTYVDGVELANPATLSQIDPRSIERIEILAGPQASTIYGSGAINGVMQIFTKRGQSLRPQLTMALLSGVVQNNFSSALTSQHDYSASVRGVEGHWSYNTGGSWTYMGPWTPAKQTSQTSGFGGARIQQGIVQGDLSVRLARTQNRENGRDTQESREYVASGFYSSALASQWRPVPPRTTSLLGQTLALTVGVAPAPWWSYDVTIGLDQSAVESRRTKPGYSSFSDTLLELGQNTSKRRTVRSTMSMQIPLGNIARSVVTVGADGWESMTTSLSTQSASLTGTLTGTSRVTRQPRHNAGGFIQAQVGLWEQLYFTYGLRSEWNPNFGADANPNLAPRYGVSQTFVVGPLTTKLRASYGRATRPPKEGLRDAVSASTYYSQSFFASAYEPYYGSFDAQLASPELGPEYQRGGEGGIELYWGNRGTLVLTRYNQVVTDLIQMLDQADSVRSRIPLGLNGQGFSRDADDYGYARQSQFVNLGSLRNQGWEVQGQVNMGSLTARGTYSWTQSRVLGVKAKYRQYVTADFWQRGWTFQGLPEHTWSAGISYARAQTTVALNLNGTGMLYSVQNALYENGISSNIRLIQNRIRMLTGGVNWQNRGYVMADINGTHQLNSHAEAVLLVQNVGDMYRNDLGSGRASLGRQTKIGLRIRY